MKRFFFALASLAVLSLLSSCAKDLGLTGGQGTVPTENFLQQEPYPENRELNLQRDMEIMWTTERSAGQTFSTVPARVAIRRVFADINLHYKGTKDDFAMFMSGSPTEKKDDRFIYRIDAPTYTDEYTVLFNSDNTFKSVEYRRIQRLKQDAGYR